MNFKKIIIILLATLSIASGESYKARVTYYWDGYRTATGVRPKSGKTIAVDPKIIRYNSKIWIPKMGKTFIAQDTGSAVKSRKASRKLGKKNIVVDIYCKNRKEALKYISKYPMFMEIKVYK